MLPDIIVSKETLDRAIEVANILYLAFERRGHSVVFVPYGQGMQRQAVDEREKGGRRKEKYYTTDLWSPARPTAAFIGTSCLWRDNLRNERECRGGVPGWKVHPCLGTSSKKVETL